jgi:hypothetical protein
MASILQYVGLRRRFSLMVPGAIASTLANLRTALAGDMVLSGPWQLTRRYWGQLSSSGTLTLHGPRGQRQFCFLTRGRLQPGVNPNETQLAGTIMLGQASEVQLLGAISVLVIVLPIMVGNTSLLVLPCFLGFLYAMTQWHFQHYSREITTLLRDLMANGSAPTEP